MVKLIPAMETRVDYNYYDLRVKSKLSMQKVAMYLGRVLGKEDYKYSRVVNEDTEYTHTYSFCMSSGEFEDLRRYLQRNKVDNIWYKNSVRGYDE